MDWRHRSSCRDEDPELFFPVGTSGPALLQVAEAKTVCRRCPVNTECLTWALETGQDDGVWGGMSEDERRSLRRRQARQQGKAPAQESEPAPAPDRVVIERLMSHGKEQGATREEVALAALELVDAGRGVATVATHLHVSSVTVETWIARRAAGEPLIQGRERRAA